MSTLSSPTPRSIDVYEESVAMDYYVEDHSRVPQPSHRHAQPSAPWPWIDIGDDIDREQLETVFPPIPENCTHEYCNGCWRGYPQSRFLNWTPRQQKKSRIYKAINEYRREIPCRCYQLDINNHGFFLNAPLINAEHGKEKHTWEEILSSKVPENNRVRVMFIENLSGPVLQMLSIKYNIEPVFWSSSLNWIPSRFQEELMVDVGDHITITLTFLRSTRDFRYDYRSRGFGLDPAMESSDSLRQPRTLLGVQNADAHAPLSLYSNSQVLLLDHLAVHLVRNVHGSFMISYHPALAFPTTPAAFLHERIHLAGQSVHWQNIFQKTADPTFLLLIFIWYTVYAWDEALENLYRHICSLETLVLQSSSDAVKLVRELHAIHTHHLHYTTLLDDYIDHVQFIAITQNPALSTHTEEERKFTQMAMGNECDKLIVQIKRLKNGLLIQERKLRSVMELSSSLATQRMMYSTLRDSAAMKQVAYLTMVFLPGTFVAGLFGMNVVEINPGTNGTLYIYAAVALPLTTLTIWILMTGLQRVLSNTRTFSKRIWWHVYRICLMMMGRDTRKIERKIRELVDPSSIV